MCIRDSPSAASLRDIAELLSSTSTRLATGADAKVIAADLDRAAVAIGALIRAELIPEAARFPSRGAAELEGALADALRRSGR